MRADRQRLDKWIWFARFARTRAAAQALIAAGHVRIGGRRATAASVGVKLGDVLTVAAPHATMVVKVVGLGERRGDASSVGELYEIVSNNGFDQM
jgi:ribosome-associated heat shock protein Hsp15